MTRSRRLALLALPLAALLVGLGLGLRDRAPDARFTTIDGERVWLAALRGHPAIVTFWASDCRTCLLEIPEFDRLSRDYARYGMRLFAVAMAYDVPSRVLSLVRESGLGYTVVLDSDGHLAAAFDDVRWVPSTFLIAPDGRIRQRTVGAVDFGLMRQQLENMLGDS